SALQHFFISLLRFLRWVAVMNLRRMVQREFTRLSPAYTRVAAARPKREVSEFVRWIHTRPDEWVLDATCGPGTLAWAIGPREARVCGLDLCPRMIQAARGWASHSPHRQLLT